MSATSRSRRDRLLYIDRPFASRVGGDKNRSCFLVSALRDRYRCDLLLVLPPDASVEDPTAYPGFETVHQIRRTAPPALASPGVNHLAWQDARRLRDWMRAAAYDVVFLRSASQVRLARLASGALPSAKIIVDCDMLLHRLAGLAWRRNRSFRNRYHLLAWIRLRRLEGRLFRRPYLFLFSNPVERELAMAMGTGGSGRFALSHNAAAPLPDADAVEATTGPSDRVLFFGSHSVTNADAYEHLVKDVLPRCRGALATAGLRLRVAGRFPSELHERLRDPTVEVAGEVPDMDAEIRAARFVILPLRVASGTRTRILEAGRWAKAVVTTPMGAEGLDFPPDALVIRESAPELAAAVSDLAAGRLDADKIGRALREAVSARYSAHGVASELCNQIESFEPRAPRSTRSRAR